MMAITIDFIAGLVWQDLEFSLMGFSVLGGIVNLTCLIITLIGLCGLEKSNGLVSIARDELIIAHYITL